MKIRSRPGLSLLIAAVMVALSGLKYNFAGAAAYQSKGPVKRLAPLRLPSKLLTANNIPLPPALPATAIPGISIQLSKPIQPVTAPAKNPLPEIKKLNDAAALSGRVASQMADGGASPIEASESARRVFEGGAPRAAAEPVAAQPQAKTASMTARLVIGPHTFEVLKKGEMPADVEALLGEAMDIETDPIVTEGNQKTDRSDIFQAFASRENPEYMAPSHGPEYSAYLKEFKKKAAAFKSKYPAIMKEHFETTLAQYGHSAERRGDMTIYHIPRGLEFWAQLLSAPSPEKRMAALAFLSSRFKKDNAIRTINPLVSVAQHMSRIIDPARLTPTELQTVRSLAEKNGRKISQQGSYLQVGGGTSFHLLRQIFGAAERLAEPALIRRFQRVIRFLAVTGISIISDQAQGAAAYYDSFEDKMAYVMPSRTDLDTTAHEINHARFARFEQRLAGWMNAKGHAIPYEVDGPRAGFMNLLNELNSWRIGESFGDKSSDAKILKILRRGYGAQAGWENVRLFSQIWTPARVKDRSVPKLIMDSVKELNSLKNEDLAQYGFEALAKEDVVKSHNFLRLVSTRYPKRKTIPEETRGAVEKMTKHPHTRVAEEARRLLKPKEPESKKNKEDEKAELKPILDPSVSREIKLKQLSKILRWALTEDTRKTVGRQERAITLIQDLFNEWGFEPLHESQKTNRPLQKNHLFFSPEIDRFLARGLFDKRRSSHRLELINIISAHTYPRELPQLHRRVLQIATSNHPNKSDFWLARMFLVPKGDSTPHVAWGEDVVEAIQKDATPSVTALEYSAEYYRLALNTSLPGPTWGEFPGTRLDGDIRNEMLQTLQKMTPLQQSRYQKAINHLWFMLHHRSAVVRTAARYAIASYPGYALGLENRLLSGLKEPPSALRLEITALVAMSERGFLTQIDQWLDGPFIPTAEEANLLKLRP